MNTSKVLKVLKSELRKNKITYNQVAVRLNMTEAGVKKLFSKEDISLKKIDAICDLLNMSVFEMLKSAENEDVEAVKFNDVQVKFFLSRPQFFHFFMKLAYEQKNPTQIQKDFGLSSKSISLYLKKLEDLGLIKRHPYEHNQILGGIPLALNTTGTELEKFKFDIAQKLLAQTKSKSDSALKGAGFCLTKDQQAEFMTKVDSLLLEFSATSRANRKKTTRDDFIDCAFMSFFVDSSLFTNVTDIA